MYLIPNPVIRIDYQSPGDEMRILAVVVFLSSLEFSGQRQEAEYGSKSLHAIRHHETGHSQQPLRKPQEMFFTLSLFCF